jgi:hypothetical protein
VIPSQKKWLAGDWARYSNMDENHRHRLSIAKELMTRNNTLPHVLAKIDKVLKSPEVSETRATI